MELRHLRCLIAGCERTPFRPAAGASEYRTVARSPERSRSWSRKLGTQLFANEPRGGTRLTWGGLTGVDGRMSVVSSSPFDQARANVQAAASVYRGMLRIALSDGNRSAAFGTLLAQWSV